MTNPLYLALDVPQLDAARALAEKVKAHVGGVKLGLEFFCAHGPPGVAQVAELGLPLFLDLKLHDIPNTVAKAVEALRPLNPAVLTVHPWELDPDPPRVRLPAALSFAHYFRLHGFRGRLQEILQSAAFGSIRDVRIASDHL